MLMKMKTKRQNWEASSWFDFHLLLKFFFLVIVIHCWSRSSSEAYESESLDPMKNNSKMEWMELRLKQLENAFLERKNKEQASAELEAGRLDKIEKELQAQKDKFSALEVKQESQFNKITTQFNSLKRSLFDNKHQHKRQADQINKNSKKVCSDSSRLCTYYFPDHPDAKAVDKSTSINGTTSNKTIQTIADSDGKKVTGPPTSCKDLNQMGHSLNGYYLVKKTYEKKNKMQTIYCNFNQVKVLENMIGNVEVKTKDVHFYVQRKSTYRVGKDHQAIPFEKEILNVGGAMNLTSGVFTAPVSGTYYFAFSTVKDEYPNHLIISIQLNGKEQGRAYTEHWNQNNYTVIKTKSSLSLTASLHLQEGNKVNMRIEYDSGAIFDTEVGQHTHFVGWLVNEELALD